ncbi:hypothetical protein Y032_0180g783 [Ancylostoma ceylanicum]|uniref:Uncharacterized protein n=1 Tax=Ancylostoma ceylanicum TaxID=53326 RepID=A0A016STB7_9BILA|nr:hypothetical protein Y032_0180g783 [Ancylostoma ceylanicum]
MVKFSIADKSTSLVSSNSSFPWTSTGGWRLKTSARWFSYLTSPTMRLQCLSCAACCCTHSEENAVTILRTTHYHDGKKSMVQGFDEKFWRYLDYMVIVLVIWIAVVE